MTDKERAEALRIAAEYLDGDAVFTPTTMRRIADGLAPPKPVIDTTLRGPVWKEYEPGYYSLYYAREDGLWVDKPFVGKPEMTWAEVIDSGHPLHPVTPEPRVRKWDEWTQEEQDRWTYVCIEPRDHANLAIEIATRQGDV